MPRIVPPLMAVLLSACATTQPTADADTDLGTTTSETTLTTGTDCTELDWYQDLDEDGSGNPSVPLSACDQPSGYVDNDDDCDDAEAMRTPGRNEICDGLDNDCDGALGPDEEDPDGDGWLDCETDCTGTGMTWYTFENDPVLNVSHPRCGDCDPYVGDTPCSEVLPVLCLYPQGLPNPGIVTDFYNGWAEGDVALTDPIPGCLLNSVNSATALCEATYGVGWRLGEHHDGGGGWSWWAYGQLDDTTRYWAGIDDQTAHCWD